VQHNFIKLPGLVDVHVHLREPGALQKEDFETGTKAAIAGGYTQILDMPNNNPPTVSEKALDDKIARAQNRIWCDLGFNFGATTVSIKYFDKVYKKSFGLKIYMNKTTGPLLIDGLKERNQIFRSWKSELPIMVHAEGETVNVAIELAKKYKRKLHVCHITFDQINSIEKARKIGVKITCEICPHHLFLNKNDLKSLGSLGVMKPPLLSKNDQQEIWSNLGKIDMISTDHAPHTLEEKYNQKCIIPSDINKNLHVLKKFSSMSESVVELGVRAIVSTWALLAGKPKRMISVDIELPSVYGGNLDEVYELSEKEGIDFYFIQGSSLDINLPEHDFLFIDTIHTREQLQKELDLHTSKVKKYIAFHDTHHVALPEMMECIKDFLEKSPEWKMEEEHPNNSGMNLRGTLAHQILENHCLMQCLLLQDY